MKPVPIKDLKPQLPQLGRIRMGMQVPTKSGNNMRPAKSQTFIFTGQRPELLDAIAADYGGTIEEWDNDKTADTHRLVTEARTVEVALFGDVLSEPCYEKWDGGTMRRRCDGVTVTGYPKDGSDPVDIDCICQGVDDESKHCKPKTHLTVMMPQTPIGGWRMVTSSMNAMRELHASYQAIVGSAQQSPDVMTRQAADGGLFKARLSMVERVSGEKQFVVPTLTADVTVGQLLAPAIEPPAAAEISDGGDDVFAGGTPVQIGAGDDVIDV